MPTFGNLAGFLALLAIPAILAIHFLQRESRKVTSSTLFLLEQLAPESAQGRRFDRLRNSVPLWLQLAAALITTWLLVDPRWVRPDAAQHVMMVLDSTVSMTAFRNELMQALDEDTANLDHAAAHTEWQVLESDPVRPTIYSGPSRDALLAAVRAWTPHLGAHDPGQQIQAAQAMLGGKGTLIFVTDRKRPLPDGVRLLAIGHPFDHCGFCGMTIDDAGTWRALVRNYGRTPQQRNWWIEADGQKSPPRPLTLQPGSSVELSGAPPPGATHWELVMDADAFPLDSRLPMLTPQLKRLNLRVAQAPDYQDFFTQFIGSLDRATLSGSTPDLTLAVYDPTNPALPATPSIVLLRDPFPSGALPAGSVTPAANSLASELNWSGLLAEESPAVPPKPDDETLVWQGNRPLIFLRTQDGARLLVVNFDIHGSNAPQLPAFILLLHRFAEEVRSAKTEEEARNFETNELISVASDPRQPPPVIAGTAEPAYRAPGEPGFFKVTQAGRELLDGATHFADPRAADFSDASSFDDVKEESAQTTRRNSQPDPLAPAWVLMLGLVMGASWGWRRK
jgi:hypothetical protein